MKVYRIILIVITIGILVTLGIIANIWIRYFAVKSLVSEFSNQLKNKNVWSSTNLFTNDALVGCGSRTISIQESLSNINSFSWVYLDMYKNESSSFNSSNFVTTLLWTNQGETGLLLRLQREWMITYKIQKIENVIEPDDKLFQWIFFGFWK